ncbi:hypothetical protein Afil01_62170 [Actinorhabdospora filicis]|uniref:Tail assembly chaperone n=1 Tax=Actinorhabdospora filicis TaxID=1785913 RepID=A0A9W6WE11_9ACTN|nr:phage tail assembly protein [Actinorhabdospora filicis]GLZ81410.1 hypothetical protein Afil01_62170 [Actinorhabdospora filicis]
MQFTLDDIRNAAEARYGSTDIAIDEARTVRLLNPLRLPRARRDELAALQEAIQAEGADQEKAITDMIRCVAETRSAGDALIKATGGDLAVLATIIERYSEGAQVGEASASQS